MTTPSPRLRLKVPAQSDRFSTADLIANWNLLDSHPGVFPCTSTTRPTDWGAAQVGMGIYETNTALHWDWNGSGWVRATGGRGVLRRSDGSDAIGVRTTDFSTGSANPVKAVSVTNVVVPDGQHTLMIVSSWKNASNPGNSDHFPATVFQSNSNNAGPVVGGWQIGPEGGTFVQFISPGLAPGNYDFSFQIAAPTGNSTLQGTTNSPISLAIIEL